MEHGVGEGDIFIVDDRVKATDKKDAFFIVQLPYLIRRKQLSATLSSDEFKFFESYPFIEFL